MSLKSPCNELEHAWEYDSSESWWQLEDKRVRTDYNWFMIRQCNKYYDALVPSMLDRLAGCARERHPRQLGYVAEIAADLVGVGMTNFVKWLFSSGSSTSIGAVRDSLLSEIPDSARALFFNHEVKRPEEAKMVAVLSESSSYHQQQL